MRYIDDIFDKRYLDETIQKLKHTAWYPTNVANSYTWPYYEKGTHKLLGDVFFERRSIDVIKYNLTNTDLSYELIDAYHAIMRRFERNFVLQGIYSNLQFKDMDGTPHIDSPHENDYAYIWMLGDYNDFINIRREYHYKYFLF